MATQRFSIDGFLKAAKLTATGKPYTGRFVFPDVQWTGGSSDLLGTFTVTAEQLADAAANNLLWTDQDVQRGIQPTASPVPDRELPLSRGYPDSKMYVFDSDKANDIAQKLLGGDKVYLSPLIWNLRPGKFEAYWDDNSKDLFLYGGKLYLPDSHHRQQGIIKAVRIWRESPQDYPSFDGQREFKIELYFLSRDEEGDYFYAKNQLPKPTSKSKSFDLTTQDDLALLAKKFIDTTPQLIGNVNRVTDRLVRSNPHIATLSTIRSMMMNYVGDTIADRSELDGMAKLAANFYQMLADVRPELNKLGKVERAKVRETSLVDSGVMFHAYGTLMKAYSDSIVREGTHGARSLWAIRLKRIAPDFEYKFKNWSGDLFSKRNPFWLETGVVKPGVNNVTVISTGASRSVVGRVLRQLVLNTEASNNLAELQTQQNA